MTRKELGWLSAWFLVCMSACLYILRDEEPKNEPCPFGQRPYAELTEQKAEAGAVKLKIVMVCREK